MTKRPRNVANDIIDAIESATGKWTKQKKSEERHPGMFRYRASRMTKEPRTTQKDAAWEVLEGAYMAASNGGTLPAMARQIYYQARPKIMAMTDDKQLAYGYFSQTLLPDYVEEKGVNWNVVYDARGHFEEPHTNISIGCGTIGVHNYLRAMHSPEIKEAAFRAGHIKTLGPRGNVAAVLFCEKEVFNPLFKAVDLANRWDLMIISTKGVSVTAARRLIETICLRENGATEEEITILLEERVELNALTSDALIEMIETKLKAHGLQKVVPSAKLLSDAYAVFHKSQKLEDAFEQLQEDMQDQDDVEVPEDLESQVRTILEAHPHLRWDNAVRLTFDESKLEDIEAEKTKDKEEAGDFSEPWSDDEEDEAEEQS
jgi:hypothetical protein